MRCENRGWSKKKKKDALTPLTIACEVELAAVVTIASKQWVYRAVIDIRG